MLGLGVNPRMGEKVGEIEIEKGREREPWVDRGADVHLLFPCQQCLFPSQLTGCRRATSGGAAGQPGGVQRYPLPSANGWSTG